MALENPLRRRKSSTIVGTQMSRTLTLVLAALLLIPLSACGRKAPLDAPSAVPVKEGEKQPEPPVEDKPFVLDRLIK